MSKQLFEPVSDKLILVPVEQDEMSAGGIMLPDIENQKTLKGVVKYAGKGFWAGAELFVPTTMKPEDTVLYQRFSAQVFEYEGTEYHIVQERDLISKINI